MWFVTCLLVRLDWWSPTRAVLYVSCSLVVINAQTKTTTNFPLLKQRAIKYWPTNLVDEVLCCEVRGVNRSRRLNNTNIRYKVCINPSHVRLGVVDCWLVILFLRRSRPSAGREEDCLLVIWLCSNISHFNGENFSRAQKTLPDMK